MYLGFMSDKLIQKDFFFNQRIFELSDTGLHAQKKGLFHDTEYSVDFDDIGIRVLKEKLGRNGWLVGSIIALLLSMILFAQRTIGGDVGSGAEVFYLMIGLVCGLVFILTYKRKFYLVKSGNTNAIEFIEDKPSKKELDDFIDRLKIRRKQALEAKYGEINLMLSYEQNYHNLMWLLNNDVIAKDEFDKRISVLNSQFNSPIGRQIGFNLGEN